MADQTAQPEAMYCLGCYYQLDHLESNACPECGRGFSSGDPKSFSRYPKPIRLRWECWLAAVLLAGLVYVSFRWLAVETILNGPINRRVSYAPYTTADQINLAIALRRLEEIVIVVPLLIAIPGLLFSAIRHSRGHQPTLGVALLLLLVYAIWPGTWTAIRDLPGALETLYRLNNLYR